MKKQSFWPGNLATHDTSYDGRKGHALTTVWRRKLKLNGSAWWSKG